MEDFSEIRQAVMGNVSSTIKKVLLYLGSSIKTIVCTIRQLREHGVYVTK